MLSCQPDVLQPPSETDALRIKSDWRGSCLPALESRRPEGPANAGRQLVQISLWCALAESPDLLLSQLTIHASNMLFILFTHFELMPVATISVSNLTLCSPDLV